MSKRGRAQTSARSLAAAFQTPVEQPGLRAGDWDQKATSRAVRAESVGFMQTASAAKAPTSGVTTTLLTAKHPAPDVLTGRGGVGTEHANEPDATESRWRVRAQKQVGRVCVVRLRLVTVRVFVTNL